MSITTELREAISKLRVECEEKEGCGVLWYPEPSRDRFSAIADRIDAALVERYVELPEDADGEVIHLGDKMDEGVVGRIVIKDDGEHSAYLYKLPNVLHEYFCADIGHVHPDSWERIIEDAQADGVRYHNDGRPSDFDALVERCKRLAGEDA